MRQLEKCGEFFNTKVLKKKIKPVDWPASLKEYLNEVRENLEKNTYDSKRSILRKWMEWLGGF